MKPFRRNIIKKLQSWPRSDLEKNLGPEYLALVDALRNIDLNSKEAQEIVSTFDTLDASCPH
jgi:hypothetical protein